MRRLWAFIIASVLIHFLVGSGLVEFGVADTKKKRDERPIDVTLVPSGPKQPKKNPLDHVVLDALVPKQLQIESQEEASLLSQRRQRVKKETVAQNYGMTQNTAQQTDRNGKTGQPGDSKSQTEPTPTKVATSEKSVRSQSKKELKASGSSKEVAGLILENDPFSDIPIPGTHRGESGADSKSEKLSQAKANDQLNQRLQALNMGDGGRSLINEKIPGVQSANITALNTNPYLYYSFYNRLVTQVRFHWETNLQNVVPSLSVMAAQRFPNREEWVTQVSLYMDPKGRVIKVDVDKSSGLADLDYAVVRAMQAGGPYRNPPPEMEEDGQIRVQLNFSLYWRPSVVVNRRDTERGSEY